MKRKLLACFLGIALVTIPTVGSIDAASPDGSITPQSCGVNTHIGAGYCHEVG